LSDRRDRRDRRRPLPRRSLVREILLTQLGYAVIVGATALLFLWLGSNWIARDNMADRAIKWAEDLDYLGAGLYLEGDTERYLRIEGYVSKFPEIQFVRYYDAQGNMFHVEARDNLMPDAMLLSSEQQATLTQIAHEDTSYQLIHDPESSLVGISTAITSESIQSDGLLDAVTLDDLQTTSQIIGYVELGLNYGSYYDQLIGSVGRASSAIALAFLGLALLGRILLRRALKPLSDIEAPLQRLAEGDTNFQVESSPHRELAAITNGLNTAVARIRERDAHLTHLANNDDLTGLPTRHFFMELVARELQSLTDETSAVLFVDLDQFKYVNDTLGHSAGDVILKQAAERIRRPVRNHDTVARFGGDEFAVLLSGATRDEAMEISDRLMESVSEAPLVFGTNSFNLNCCVGIAIIDGQTFTPSELLAQADLACQQAKADGRNRARMYEPELGAIESIKVDMGWSQKLHHALKHNLFLLHYQPIQSLKTGEITHFEVLLRMQDGDELHFPGAFLPAADRFGLMRDIDRWVIEHAIANLAWFRRRDSGVRFSINLSGGSFVDGDLVEFIVARLAEHAIPANAIVLEITEQVAVGSVNEAMTQINELIEVGCEFALDDFGAGYSSLTYLKKLPVHYIKIDGMFIQKLTHSSTDQVIVQAIAQIAQVTGKKTVAEFVEDAATLELLRDYGIDYAQGNLIGVPDTRIQRISRNLAKRTPLSSVKSNPD
jgi:diguanylate cyclase (GGDEF)-like protein